MNASDITVRSAEITDAHELSRLIHELAEYEKMADKCTATPESVSRMMNEENGLRGVIAEMNGKTVGMAVFSLYKLATFSGKRVLYIEDIFVEEALRGYGIGKMIFDEIIRTAESLECIKIEWKCLAWNTSARSFYESRGGVSDPDWLTYTLDLRKD
ncbi:MAG: GNAT family N-acetyltransferase [Oscillospiraceae bacterium]|nr:GNAT family N-acetyltransferase [Oscillospiraceae bacterium]